MELINTYNCFIKKYGLEEDEISSSCLTQEIRNMLRSFMMEHKRVAIYCYGQHTDMLLAEFVFELKDIVCIVDNYIEDKKNGGYTIIKDEEIEENLIDAVIISSYGLRKQISNSMRQYHPSIEVLDLYEELEKKGIRLKYSYYQTNHPFHNYSVLNQLQRELKVCTDKVQKTDLLYQIIFKYVHIKDFYSAKKKAEELNIICPSIHNQHLLEEIQEIYSLELDLAEHINDNNVLMLCVDALRAQDFNDFTMPKTYKALYEKGYMYNRAYAYSTSTYESLIPVYSENNDMRTHYYEKDSVKSSECPFYTMAKKQGRKVYFYTDMGEYIEDEEAKRVGRSQTTSEKIWSFLIDASKESNGLFYIHNSFESHFSFANPYTDVELVVGGQNILYDYLDQKGGELRTDYMKQHDDAIKYIDDMFGPIIRRLNNKLLFYADHGTIILERNTQLDDVKNEYLICHEECLRIPLVIISPQIGTGKTDEIKTLMDFNGMMKALLNNEIYHDENRKWIKIGRSAIYNPEFKNIYMRKNLEKGLLAFEGFVFSTGEKLIIFSNGTKELYNTEDDTIIDDMKRIDDLFHEVKHEVTVIDD